MKKYEIIAESNFPIENQFDLIIPFDFTADLNGNLIFHVYDAVRDTAQKFAELFISNPFSDEAYSWIGNILKSYVNDVGYTADDDSNSTSCMLYKINDAAQINSAVIKDSSKILTSDSIIENLTEFDLDFKLCNKLECAVSIENGKIVSAAAENPRFAEDNVTEIGVETVEKYRNLGLASSNIALLSKRLIGIYDEIQYLCSSCNTASRISAERAGFIKYGEAYYFSAGRNL